MAKSKNILNTYRDKALERISTDEKEYHRFLEYCGRGNIHKLSFNSQLVLFWQKPYAQVVAGFDAWNRGAGNRILPGSHGAGIYEEPGMSYRGYLESSAHNEILSMVIEKSRCFSKVEQKEALAGLEEMVFNQYFVAHPEMILGKNYRIFTSGHNRAVDKPPI